MSKILGHQLGPYPAASLTTPLRLFRTLKGTHMLSALRPGALVLLAYFCSAALSAAQTTAAAPASPKIDKAALTEYLRYAEGFTPKVEIAADDPKPSKVPGFWQITLHLRMGKNEAVRNYYITQDGQHIISGSVFDLRQSPFANNLAHLEENGAPAIGPEKAPIQIYVFSDFECPYCREEAKVLRQNVAKTHANDVRIIFKNFPLDPIHPWARPAAIAGGCIGAQQPAAFWTFHDWIYDHQQEINKENLKTKVLGFAQETKLDSAKLESCLADPAAAEQVEKTVQEGRQLGVQQTPTVFVNGRMLSGALTADQIDLLIQLEQTHRQQQSALIPQSCCEVSIPVIGRH